MWGCCVIRFLSRLSIYIRFVIHRFCLRFTLFISEVINMIEEVARPLIELVEMLLDVILLQCSCTVHKHVLRYSFYKNVLFVIVHTNSSFSFLINFIHLHPYFFLTSFSFQFLFLTRLFQFFHFLRFFFVSSSLT